MKKSCQNVILSTSRSGAPFHTAGELDFETYRHGLSMSAACSKVQPGYVGQGQGHGF